MPRNRVANAQDTSVTVPGQETVLGADRTIFVVVKPNSLFGGIELPLKHRRPGINLGLFQVVLHVE